MPSTITHDQLERALGLRDLTDPAAGLHAMQAVVTAILHAVAADWGCPVVTYRASPVVAVRDHYEALGYPAEAPARDARYTRYVDEQHLLRAHTSAMVPAALRRHAGGRGELAIACPGLVYRRDVVDRLHVGEPHQLDIWRVRCDAALTEDDLDRMIALVVEAVLPGARHRALPASHPYTRHGREVEVETPAGRMELLECGLAADHVLAAGGLDPGRWTGLALGIGLDRALMLRKGIADIRLLRSTDPRIERQMLTLDPYRPVSSMPPTVRDLSIAVEDDATAEEVGDRVRDGLPQEMLAAVEEVAVLAETPAAELPDQAIARIGLRPGQKNMLVRLVLRHPSRTLTGAESNAIRDRVYARLHRGSAHQWASPDIGEPS